MFLEANDIEVLNSPAKSPNLNIIENVWDVMALRVFAGDRQFGCVTDLRNAITDAWQLTDFRFLQTL